MLLSYLLYCKLIMVSEVETNNLSRLIKGNVTLQCMSHWAWKCESESVPWYTLLRIEKSPSTPAVWEKGVASVPQSLRRLRYGCKMSLSQAVSKLSIEILLDISTVEPLIEVSHIFLCSYLSLTIWANPSFTSAWNVESKRSKWSMNAFPAVTWFSTISTGNHRILVCSPQKLFSYE